MAYCEILRVEEMGASLANGHLLATVSKYKYFYVITSEVKDGSADSGLI